MRSPDALSRLIVTAAVAYPQEPGFSPQSRLVVVPVTAS
jgi:hypothetical protein